MNRALTEDKELLFIDSSASFISRPPHTIPPPPPPPNLQWESLIAQHAALYWSFLFMSSLPSLLTQSTAPHLPTSNPETHTHKDTHRPLSIYRVWEANRWRAAINTLSSTLQQRRTGYGSERRDLSQGCTVAVCWMKSDLKIKLDVPCQLINATLWISVVTCCITVFERLWSTEGCRIFPAHRITLSTRNSRHLDGALIKGANELEYMKADADIKSLFE